MLPSFFPIRQKFGNEHVADVPRAVDQELAKLKLQKLIASGQSVALTAGSRGIANIALVLKSAVAHLRKLGAEPFIVPAMGSHGGGTAAGQRRLIEGYGVTESFCDCPILSSMDTTVVCQTDEGFPVHFDRYAHSADHVLVVNRVKPHTDFSGDIQSGLMKMLLIGLGKHEGAKIYHRAVLDYSFDQIVRSVARKVIERCRILGAIGLVENAHEQTAIVEAMPPDEIEERDKALLRRSRELMARLPFERIDLLIVDEMGKNISGTGVDANVVGRKFDAHKARDDEWPKIRRIFVRALTAETHGNACGIGLTEFCTTRLIGQIDHAVTRTNLLTSGRISVGMLPLDFPSDRAAIEAALPTIGLTPPEQARIVWIRNTLELERMQCSAALATEVQARPDLEVLGEATPLTFDKDGNLAKYCC